MSLFITFEGGEGVGKTALIKELSALLLKDHIPHVLTREPGGTTVANQIRELFGNPPKDESLTKLSEFMLLSAARNQHVEFLIKPSLAQGKVVISDRYADSSRAYQGILGGLEEDFMEVVIKKSTLGLEPNVTFLLDCDVNITKTRVHSRRVHEDSIERFDQAETAFHESLRLAYLQLAKKFPHRFHVIDTSQSLGICLENITSVLKKIPGFIRGLEK